LVDRQRQNGEQLVFPVVTSRGESRRAREQGGAVVDAAVRVERLGEIEVALDRPLGALVELGRPFEEADCGEDGGAREGAGTRRPAAASLSAARSASALARSEPGKSSLRYRLDRSRWWAMISSGSGERSPRPSSQSANCSWRSARRRFEVASYAASRSR